MKLLTTTALLALMITPAFVSPALAEGWQDDYQVLKFGILSSENEQDRLMRNEPIREHLEKVLGVKVEMFSAGNYDGVIQALAAGQIEVARLGSSSYASAFTATNGKVVPTLTSLKKDGSTGYYSVLVTRCDSGIKNLEDAKGKVLAFADPDSTSGYQVPYYNLVEREGITPETYFAAIPFSGSHEAGVQGVYNGTFEVAATYQNNDANGIYQRMEAKNMIDAGQICKIWESPEITSGPWTFNEDLPTALIEDVTAAIMAFPEADPEGWKLYSSFDPEDENPTTGFSEVNKERYQWTIDMREWFKKQRRSN